MFPHGTILEGGKVLGKVLDVQEHIAPERIITLADAYHTNLTNVSGQVIGTD